MLRKFFIIIFSVIVAAVALKFILQEKSQQVKIGDAVFSVEVAQTFEERIRGLSGRTGLKRGEGMLFIFEKPDLHSFWMKGMIFSLDLIWIKGDQVVGISEDLPPDSSASPKIYYPPTSVDKVLEINGGLVAKYGIRIGDTVELQAKQSK